jgi:hypothetical protein
MLPACARDLFNARHGFASGKLAVASGSEILRACPTIRACAPRLAVGVRYLGAPPTRQPADRPDQEKARIPNPAGAPPPSRSA